MIPEDHDPLDQSRLTQFLGFRITRAELRIRRLFLDCVAHFDLKPVDFALLVLVDTNPGTSQRQLAVALDVSPPNLAIVVARLMKRDLLHQVRSQQDRRVQHLHLSAAGKSLLTQAEKAVQRMESGLLERVGAERTDTLLRALERLEKLD